MSESCVQCPKCKAYVATGALPAKRPFRDAVTVCPKCGIQFTWKTAHAVLADPDDVVATV